MFTENTEKENILIAYLPAGKYVGIKLFQSRPTSFKNEAARLAWDKQSAANSITLKQQLERGQISPESIAAQLVMHLDLNEEEVAAFDYEREAAERRFRVQFLKTEMKLIELDAKIKTCLCLEKADTDLCLKLLDELMGLEVKALMLLKHPACLETVKRMRAYVGNPTSWDLSESATITFGKQAQRIRKQADTLYNNMKKLFPTPVGLTFWEFFSDRVNQFKRATSDFSADELLELVYEPLGLSWPCAHTMRTSIDAANEVDMQEENANKEEKETPETPKRPAKRPRRENAEEADGNDTEEKSDDVGVAANKETHKEAAADTKEEDNKAAEEETDKDKNVSEEENVQNKDSDKDANKETPNDTANKESADVPVETESAKKEKDKKDVKDSAEKDKKETKSSEIQEKSSSSSSKSKDDAKEKNSSKRSRNDSKDDKSDKEDKDVAEPRAKRSRESKKTETPPARSPAKRKSKF